MTEKTWRDIPWQDCPACGDAIEVLTNAGEGKYWEDDEVRCVSCDWRGSIQLGDEMSGEEDEEVCCQAYISEGNVMDLCEEHNKLDCTICKKRRRGMGNSGMTFGVILSIDCTKDDNIEGHLPRAELVEQMDKTEDDSEFDYGYLEGPWEGGHHIKLVGLIDEKDFDALIEDMDLYASETETMGIIGAPWSESGIGWAPAMCFEPVESEVIINAYVTPFPSNKENREIDGLTEKEWERARKKVLKKYGRKA